MERQSADCGSPPGQPGARHLTSAMWSEGPGRAPKLLARSRGDTDTTAAAVVDRRSRRMHRAADRLTASQLALWCGTRRRLGSRSSSAVPVHAVSAKAPWLCRLILSAPNQAARSVRCARLDVNRPTRPHAMEGHVMEAKAGRTRHQDIVASHVTGHKVMPPTTRCSSLSPDGPRVDG